MRVRRLVKRIVLVAVGLIALAIGGAVVFVHTDYGRDVIRGRLEHKLAGMFVGRATIGRLDGSPFTTLVLHDIAVDDADGHPALRIATLRVDVALWALLDKRLHVDRLIAEDVTVALARAPDGKLEIGKLLQHKPPSGWDYELPRIEIVRGRVIGELATVDAIEVRGQLARAHDGSLRADLAAFAIWREHGPVAAVVSVRQDRHGDLLVPSAFATIGGALVAASGVVVRDASGVVLVDAPRAAVNQLAGIELPDRVTVLATVWPDRFIDAVGTLGDSSIQVMGQVDLAARRVHGVAVTGGVDVPRGRAGGVATFDIAQGDPQTLPIGTAFATAWTVLAGQPRAQLGIAISSDGSGAGIALDGSARSTRATAGAHLSRIAERLSITGGWLAARSADVPEVRGTVTARLRASGELSPHLDLAVIGALDGAALRVRDLSAATVHLAIDAKHLPARASGTARATVAGLARGTMQLGDVELSATSRADGKLAVALASRLRAGWLLAGDALVTVGPTPTRTIGVAFGHHLVRLGGTSTWSGDGGRLDVSASTIAVAGVRSASQDGSFVLDGSLDRHTRRIAVALTATSPFVDSLAATGTLALPAHAGELAAWRAGVETLEVKATAIHVEPELLARAGIASAFGATVDLAVEVGRGAHRATLTAYAHRVHGPQLVRPLDVRIDVSTDEHETRGTIALRGPGQVNLGDLAIAIPRAAEAIGRETPIAGTLKLTTAPVPMFAMVLGRDQLTGGLLDGTVAIGGTLGAPALDANLVATGLAVPSFRSAHMLSTIDRLAIKGTWRAGQLEVSAEGMEKTGGTMRLSARGSPTRLDEIAVSLVAKQFDLAPILAMAPGRAVGGAGRIDANLTMLGVDPRTATYAGELHVVDGRIPISPTIGTLRKAKIDVTIAHDTLRLVVESKLGAGSLTAKGTVSLLASATAVDQVDIQLRKVSPIGVLQPVIDADITAKVHRTARRWVADVVVDHGLAVFPKRSGERLAPIGAPQEMIVIHGKQIVPHAKARRPPDDPVLVGNITVHPMQVIDEAMRGVIAGQITMTSDRDAFGIVGSFHAERGDLDLFGRRYVLDRGSVYFDGSADPLLDIKLSHDYPEVTTTTTLHGRLSKPVLAMTANPGVFSQGQLLGFLLGGEPTGDPRDVTTRDRATAAGESLVANQVGTYIKGNLPIKVDVLRYESGTATNSAALTAGSWLTHELFVAYRRHLEARPDENSGEGEVEYWIGRRTSIEGTVGDRGYDGIDLLWRKRY